jgi:flagellar motor protein MotB
VAVLVLLGGCAASKRQASRLKVAEAELVNERQRNAQLADAADQARLQSDRAHADLQESRHRAQIAAAQAADAQRATDALAESTESAEDLAARLARMEQEFELVSRRARERTRPAPTPPPMPPAPDPDLQRRESRQVEALAADLRSQLTRRNIRGLPVEIRTMRSGTRGVAVVLQNAFEPGKDSLAHNVDAVRAIVNLGRLISEAYPGSRVTVEGHTDSDPIRHSDWESNEHLSLARAEAVMGLLTKAGVPASSIEVSGQGARQPIAAGTTARAKAQNRRVEIYIQPGPGS